ncbi:MAG: DUF4830 domain-containing protein [Oscillospiraceae bacterium]|nr:DUF4830 domain-containing protein [Oscillospiraceae bacterium]
MLTASVKTTKTKLLGTACVILAAIIALILFFGEKEAGNAAESISRHVSDNGERIAYIASKGFKTAEEPSSVEDVLLPEEPDEILLEYNELQKKSGFDLSPYYGKTVKKYVYPLLEEEETYVTLYVFEETIIAAEVASHIEGWQRAIDCGENIR